MNTAVVSIITNELTDLELNALTMAAILDSDPRGRAFDYDKVAPLFTEEGGTRMHQVTKEIVMALNFQRQASKV